MVGILHRDLMRSIALSALLAGCGGGGTGPNSTPAPIPAPSYQKLDEMTGSRSFELTGIHVNRQNTESTGSSLPYSGQARIGYDAAADTYTLSATSPQNYSVVFGSQDKFAGNTVADQVVYNRNDGTLVDNAQIITPVINGVTMTYTTMVGWGHANSQGTQVILAVGGIPTRSDDMPKTGAATYSTASIRSGVLVNGVGAAPQDSSFTFTADFGAGKVHSDMRLTVSNNDWRYVGDGTITGGGPGFSGTLLPNTASGSPGPGSGKFEGAFFGPGATEMGFAWFLTDPGFEAEGLVGGRKLP